MTLKLIKSAICMLFCFAITYITHLQAQTANIYIGQTDQTIRGFGGITFPRWFPDLTSDQADKAFGNGNGEIGLSILRISISPNQNQWNMELSSAQRAVSHGAIVFASPWSPPAYMKTNNNLIRGQLRTDMYDDYANYLKDFYDYMSSNGVTLYAISIQNEPDWLPDYESCGWSGSQIRTFLDNNASVIPTRVMAPETVHYKSSYMDAIAGSSQVDILASHLYGGNPTRYSSSKDQWMTEHYTDSSNSANDWPLALGVGKEVHDVMVTGYNAYIWWLIRRYYGFITDDGNVSKRGFVMSHFSKFVRPGYTRVRADAAPTSGVSVSAYHSGNNLVLVAINQNSSSRSIDFNFSGYNVTNITKYETTGATGNNVSQVGSYSGGTTLTNTLAGNSIATFVGTIGNTPTNNDIWLEAECGNTGSSWNTNSDGNASNDSYVTINSGNSYDNAPESNGQISYNFNVSNSGNYNVWARVIAPNADDDSFWVRMDSGSWVKWNNIAIGSSWHWDQVHNADNGNQVVSFNLSSGNHTLTIGYREDGTYLDKLYLTNSGATPSGEGNAANNCNNTARTTKPGTLVSTLLDDTIYNNDAPFSIGPNPINNTLTVTIPGLAKNQEAKLSIFSILGNLIKTTKLKSTKNKIDLDQLKSGVYLINLDYNNTTTTRKFIKK